MTHDPGASCLCTSDHRPPVLEYELHHIQPTYLAGPDVPENKVWICPTTHTNTHELLRLMIGAGRCLSYYELQQLEDRPVSRYAATLAADGYVRAFPTPTA